MCLCRIADGLSVLVMDRNNGERNEEGRSKGCHLMTSRTVRLAMLAALGAGVTLSLQACALGSTEPAAAASTPTCTSDDIRADVTWQPGSKRMGLVALTNTSDEACRLSGRAAVTLTNAANEVVDVPTENVDQPGPAAAFDLPAGTTAFEGIKWTVCDKGDASCGVGNGLRVTLPGADEALNAELSGFPAPEKSDITMAKLWVGTIQPSRQGVVAW